MPQVIPAVIAAIAYVGTAATAVVAGTATFAQIATVAAVGIGSGVAATQGARLLSPQVGSTGANVQWHADPDEPLRFAFGRVGVKGSIKDAAVYGPDRMYVSFACTVSAAGPIKRFVSFRANDYYMTFNGIGMATSGPYANEMWLSTRLGAQPDTALSLPSNLKNSAAFPGWNSGRKLSGSAAYLVTLGENSKGSAYDHKVPSFLATIEGLFCYDPRLDSTYPGGSGSCRLNDPTTWVWTENPILFALKWALGLWEGPTGKGAPGVDYQVGGIGASISSIHLSSAVEAANISDANGWKGAAWPSTDDDKAQVLDGFLKAGGAKYGEIAGKIAFIHRAAPRSTVFTVTARDTAGPVELDTTASRLNRINTIRPRYWAEDQEWQMTALPEVTSTVWQTEDGQGVAVKRTRGVDYAFVPLAKQARELATLDIAHGREGIRGRVPLRPYMDPEPGNCFIFDEPDFALAGLKCFVLNVEDDTENDTVIVTFETETDGKYPFAYGQTGSPPPPQELSPIDPTFVSPPGAGDWTITVRPPAPGGGQMPGFDLTGIVGNATATAILVEHGPSATGPWTQAYQGPPTVTTVPIDGLQPGATYYVAVSYQRDSNYSERQVYGPYTAPLLVADTISETGPIFDTLTQMVNDALADFDPSGAIGDQLNALEAVDAELTEAIGELGVENGYRIADILNLSEQNGYRIQEISALQIVTDGVVATNASQALVLVDLAENKVEVSDYDVLRAEVTNGRNGQASLLGEIQRLSTVDLDLATNKASVSSVTALAARTTTNEADIIDLDIALATETTARAQAISQVTARNIILPNIIQNGDFRDGLAGYTQSSGWVVGTAGAPGGPGTGYAYCEMAGQRDLWTDLYPVETTLSFGAVAGVTGAATLNLVIEWWNSSTGFIEFGDIATAAAGGFTTLRIENDTRPTNANRFRVLARKQGASGAAYFTLLKVNTGSFATPWTDDATARSVSASVTSLSEAVTDLETGKASAADVTALNAEVDGVAASVSTQSLAIIDLEQQQALAYYEVAAAASGAQPARLRLVSSSLGSAVALDAPYIYFGQNTVFDDATDTLQTVTGSTRRVLAFGAGFGTDGTLTEWEGPSNVALSGMSRANAYYGRASVEPRVFGSALPSGGAEIAPSVIGFAGDIGISHGSQLTAGEGADRTVPATGRFVIDLSGTTISDQSGSTKLAVGNIRLYVVKAGVETLIGTFSASTSSPEEKAVVGRVEYVHAYSGALKFRVKLQGGGPASSSNGTVSGSVSAIYYPS